MVHNLQPSSSTSDVETARNHASISAVREKATPAWLMNHEVRRGMEMVFRRQTMYLTVGYHIKRNKLMQLELTKLCPETRKGALQGEN